MQLTKLIGIFPILFTVVNGRIAEENHRSDNSQPRVRSAFISPAARAAPPKSINGHFQFNDKEEVTFWLEGVMEKHIQLTRRGDINAQKPMFARRNNKREQSMVYENRENSMLCRKDCDQDTGDCDFYCSLIAKDNGYFIDSNGRAMTIEMRNHVVDAEPPVPPKQQNTDAVLRKLEEIFNLLGLKKRSIPDISQTGIIKLRMVPDAAYMNRFLSFDNGDVDAAKTTVTKFLTLAANEMTLAYQSLKSYGLTMTIHGNARNLDLAVYIAEIVFPDVNSAGNGFVNPSWSEESVVDGIMQFRYDSGVGYNKGLESFRQWVINNPSTIRYDHASALTGYQIHQIVGTTTYYPNGVAWIGTACDTGSAKTGYHTSMVTLYGGQGRLLAHEVGHSLGSKDDGSTECPAAKYIMSPSSVIPSEETISTYYTFSPCSANAIRDRLDKLSANDFVWTCLYDSGVSQDGFQQQYCNQGLTGDYYTLQKQCQLTFGSTSFVCSPNDDLTTNNYVTKCRRESENDHPLYCHRAVDGECVPIVEVNDGTKCTKDGTKGSNICFKGTCVNAADVCSSATTVVVTGAPTTKAPTTKAPTTQAPTTKAPTTKAPTTQAPTTKAPTTKTPTTQAPTTKAPTTKAPTTQAPTTKAPTTKAPTTQAPTTKAPTTKAPTTKAPTTKAPTTQAPTTKAPTTKAPTTQAPTTKAPTTKAPTTTGAPSTNDPTEDSTPWTDSTPFWTTTPEAEEQLCDCDFRRNRRCCREYRNKDGSCCLGCNKRFNLCGGIR